MAKTGELRKALLPAIGMWGTLDHLMPKEGMRIYAPLIPGIELRPIRDAGHVITDETPEEVNSGLLDLLGRVHRDTRQNEATASQRVGG